MSRSVLKFLDPGAFGLQGFFFGRTDRRMLEVSMSVWPNLEPASPALSGSEGALVSVSIDVKPRYLERLLEALAQLPFPINPEICHGDGREGTEDVTLVEFPAYASRLEEVRKALEACGFKASSMRVTGMLEEIQEAGRRVRRRPCGTSGGA